MANVRCKGDHSDHLVENARSQIYVAIVEPLKYPSTSVICGIKGCTEPGLVHLNKKEWQAYRRGERIFDLYETNAVKLKVNEESQTI